MPGRLRACTPASNGRGARRRRRTSSPASPVDTPFLPLDLVARLKAALLAKGAPCAIAASERRAAIPSPGYGAWSSPTTLADALQQDVRALHRFAEAQGCAVAEFASRRDRRRSHRSVLQRQRAGRPREGARAVLASGARRVASGPLLHRHRRLEELRQDDAGRAPRSRRSRGAASGSRPSSTRTMTCARTTARRTASGTRAPAPSRPSSSRPTPGRLRASCRHAAPPDARRARARYLGRADIVLVEGFKSAPIPKIEVRRLASPTQEPLAASDAHVIAVAADHAVETHGLPVFDLDDAEGIAAFIASTAPQAAEELTAPPAPHAGQESAPRPARAFHRRRM